MSFAVAFMFGGGYGFKDTSIGRGHRLASAVAAELTPHVAALQVTSGGRSGAGSAVVFTHDGFLLTNAHVVAGAQRGTAEFADGAESTFDVVGSDPLSDLAVLRSEDTREPKDGWPEEVPVG